jgi:ER membrane protein complex subunit 1
MAGSPHRPLLVLLTGLLAVSCFTTLASAIYEDQIGLADWYGTCARLP